MIIAIDGPAASGKGTLAKRLAAAFDLPHLDTGLLYRATARAVLDLGHDVDTAKHDTARAVDVVIVSALGRLSFTHAESSRSHIEHR